MIQLDIFKANDEKKAGIKRSLEASLKTRPRWFSQAMHLLKFHYKPYGEFESSDFRKWLETQDIDMQGVNGRAFGGFFKSAMKNGIVEFVRVGKTKNTKAHGTNCNYYKKI